MKGTPCPIQSGWIWVGSNIKFFCIWLPGVTSKMTTLSNSPLPLLTHNMEPLSPSSKTHLRQEEAGAFSDTLLESIPKNQALNRFFSFYDCDSLFLLRCFGSWKKQIVKHNKLLKKTTHQKLCNSERAIGAITFLCCHSIHLADLWVVIICAIRGVLDSKSPLLTEISDKCCKNKKVELQ